jgi:hypothetical protein
MDLIFSLQTEFEPDELEKLGTLTDIEKQQFIITAESFWGAEIDLDEGYAERYENEFYEIMEFGMRKLHIVDKKDRTRIYYDAWSNCIDAVHIFHHNTTDQAGVKRIQGGFDPLDENDAAHVQLARDLDEACRDTPPGERP